MSNILEEICEAKRQIIAQRKSERSLSWLEQKAKHLSKPRGFAENLEKRVMNGGTGLIAEIKQASPSAGLIRPNFDPATLATAYARAGAACLSVLTDEPFFQGRNQDLTDARDACSLPVLRKDFMLDPWQIVESRAIGADCVLLILAALDEGLTHELYAAALDYGMDVLLEVHDREELERALALESGLIGINNRDLKTLKVDIHLSLSLAKSVPPFRIANRPLVSESGIQSNFDINRLKQVGIRCFLVGESLLKQPDLEAATRELLNDAP